MPSLNFRRFVIRVEKNSAIVSPYTQPISWIRLDDMSLAVGEQLGYVKFATKC